MYQVGYQAVSILVYMIQLPCSNHVSGRISGCFYPSIYVRTKDIRLFKEFKFI